MGEPAVKSPVPYDEYLRRLEASDERLEYVDGEIFAMSGGTREHSLLGHNVGVELGTALLDRPCEVHGSDLKIKSAAGKYHYADAFVLCGATVFEDEARDVVLNPKVIVEVLSPSTERYDRGDKFAAYREIASFMDYVLVSQAAVLVEHFHRQADGTWLYRTLGPGERLVLPSLGCEVSVDRLYLEVFPTG